MTEYTEESKALNAECSKNNAAGVEGRRRRAVLITGGSRGIGAACARLFVRRGDRVIIGYRENRETAERLAAELNACGMSVNSEDGTKERGTAAGRPDGSAAAPAGGGKPADCDRELLAAALPVDVTSQAEVQAMFAAARRIFGRIDVLVNNAGISEFALFTDITQTQWDRMMDTNCRGMFFCAQEALKDMLPEKRGAIVNVSSMWGQVGSSCEVHYSASKAAVIGLTRALAKELGPSQIRVNCVAPGVVDTDMMSPVTEDIRRELAEETPLSRLGTPEDIARAVYFLASEDAAFITGQVLGVSGGFAV